MQQPAETEEVRESRVNLSGQWHEKVLPKCGGAWYGSLTLNNDCILLQITNQQTEQTDPSPVQAAVGYLPDRLRWRPCMFTLWGRADKAQAICFISNMTRNGAWLADEECDLLSASTLTDCSVMEAVQTTQTQIWTEKQITYPKKEINGEVELRTTVYHVKICRITS